MTIAPPRNPAHLGETEVLIKEARQRQRRRQLTIVGVVIAPAIALAVFLVGGSTGGIHRTNVATTASDHRLALVDAKAFHGEGNLAFVSAGRLYVLDGTTDTLTNVKTGDWQTSRPVFSPNGKWLTYVLNNGDVGLASANGTKEHVIATTGTAQWLPNSELDLDNSIWSVTSNAKLQRIAAVPQGLVGWSPDGSEYVFATDSLKVAPTKSAHGIEQIEVANSLTGKRTLWYKEKTSFTAKGGIHANFVEDTYVLSHNDGLLLTIDPDQSDDADGSGLYELRAPGADLKELAVTLGPGVGGNVELGTNGNFVIGGGGNRYAWTSKSVMFCNAVRETCKAIDLSSGALSLDPAWSPNHKTLAFIEASSAPQASIGQNVVAKWYMTHRLAILRGYSERPVVISGTNGASTPMWSKNGKSLLYVARNDLWLLRTTGSKPTQIVLAPLFAGGIWPSYYGEVRWSSEFAWTQG